MKVLIIEDDQQLAEALQEEFKRFYVADVVYSGKEGSSKAEPNAYGLIVIDVGLPDTDGISVCKSIRKRGTKTPILMLTGRDEVESKVAALEAGADDYLTKPFHLGELFARSRALLRRSPAWISDTLVSGELVLNPTTRVVTYYGKKISLRRQEFDLLEHFMRNPGHVLTRRMIVEQVWGGVGEPASNTVDVHIKSLRDKLERPSKTKLFTTIPGVGYAFRHESQEE